MEKRPPALVGTEKRREDLLPRQGRGQRQVAAGQALRQAEKIRRHPLLRADQHRAQPAEGDKHLVQDQMHLVLPAERGDRAHEARRLQSHAGRALDRGLQDEAGRSVRPAPPAARAGAAKLAVASA